jgi:O-antigen/teichoic acid export membrane protein
MISNLKKLLFSKLNLSNERSARASKNVIVAFIGMAITLIISFIMVPLTLGFIGKVEYGIWLTLSSIVAWFSYFDVGLGNGLRNKLAEALARNDKETSKIYISSSYALISIIAACMFIGFLLFANFVSWNNVLNINSIPNSELFKIVSTVFFFFCMGFSMKTLSSILQAMQLYAINDIIGIITQLLGLTGIYFLINYSESSLFLLCLIYGSQNAIVLLFASFILFATKLKDFRPQFKYVSLKKSLPLLNLGGWFFLNQILYMVTTQSSLFIVVQLFGPGDVTEFNLAKRYMALVSMVFMMVLTPFLAAFTEAYIKQDFTWIRKTMRLITWIWFGTILFTLALIIGYRVFFNIWVGGSVMPAFYLIVLMGFQGIAETLTAAYTLFLNGIGKIRLQFFTLSISAILFIPMVLLFNYLGFGLNSLILPAIIFASISAILFKYQYEKVLKGYAVGIWNK